jgi:hypothetical protein
MIRDVLFASLSCASFSAAMSAAAFRRSIAWREES